MEKKAAPQKNAVRKKAVSTARADRFEEINALKKSTLKAYPSELVHDARGELINILGCSGLLSLIGARIVRMDPAGCRIKRRAAAERICIADAVWQVFIERALSRLASKSPYPKEL